VIRCCLLVPCSLLLPQWLRCCPVADCFSSLRVIQGSWVARNATPPINNMTVTCTYCEQKYTYSPKKKKAMGRNRSRRDIRPVSIEYVAVFWFVGCGILWKRQRWGSICVESCVLVGFPLPLRSVLPNLIAWLCADVSTHVLCCSKGSSQEAATSGVLANLTDLGMLNTTTSPLAGPGMHNNNNAPPPSPSAMFGSRIMSRSGEMEPDDFSEVRGA
jgi:hypothetical protein